MSLHTQSRSGHIFTFEPSAVAAAQGNTAVAAAFFYYLQHSAQRGPPLTQAVAIGWLPVCWALVALVVGVRVCVRLYACTKSSTLYAAYFQSRSLWGVVGGSTRPVGCGGHGDACVLLDGMGTRPCICSGRSGC